jgi:hypothetical protein
LEFEIRLTSGNDEKKCDYEIAEKFPGKIKPQTKTDSEL